VRGHCPPVTSDRVSERLVVYTASRMAEAAAVEETQGQEPPVLGVAEGKGGIPLAEAVKAVQLAAEEEEEDEEPADVEVRGRVCICVPPTVMRGAPCCPDLCAAACVFV